MTLDNMTAITEGSYTWFCKSQLITCNFVKSCNGVCPFEDALKHADKEMNEQTVIDHDRDWIIGCIEHDGFIKTDRFDKANQIILDALSAEAKTKCVAQIKVDTEDVARRIKEEYDIMNGWIPCSERLPSMRTEVIYSFDGIVSTGYMTDRDFNGEKMELHWEDLESGATIEPIAWMPLPKPYIEEREEYELATEQMEHDALYEPTYNPEDGSM